ncbi:MAG: hypothetical protein H6620_12215 [Halobacteriovoraceae bacterium]|nr:hypothetical protein [Halobacteriovoraceae bacterium]
MDNTIELLLSLAATPVTPPKKRHTLSRSATNPASLLRKRKKNSCFEQFHYESPQKSAAFELSFEEKPDVPEVMRDFEEFSEKLTEKANNLLLFSELHASKTTAFTEKSSFLSKNRDHSSKNVVKRLFLRDKQAKERLKSLKKQENERVFKENTGKPQISAQSRSFFANSTQTPLFLRTDEVLKKRKEEIERLRKGFEEKARENIERELTFRPETLNVGKKHASSEEMLEEFERWRKRKEAKIEKVCREMLEKELKDATFHPKVNELSKKLAERRRKKGEKARENGGEAAEIKNEKNKRVVFALKNNNAGRTKKKEVKFSKKREDFFDSNKENLEGNYEETPKKSKNLGKNPEKVAKIKENSNLSSKKSSRDASKASKTSKNSEKSPGNSLINVVKFEPSLSFLLNLLKKP